MLGTALKRNLGLAVAAFVVLVAGAGLLSSPSVARADPTSATPPPSPRIEHLNLAVDDTYVIPEALVGCGFPITEHVEGFIALRGLLNPDGTYRAFIDTYHLTYTDEALGRTVVDRFYTTRLDLDAVFEFNPDGTMTLTARRVGHLSYIKDAAHDLGLFDFKLVFDPETGQELSFEILRHAGQIGGFWSGPDYGFDPAAYCALFTS